MASLAAEKRAADEEAARLAAEKQASEDALCAAEAVGTEPESLALIVAVQSKAISNQGAIKIELRLDALTWWTYLFYILVPGLLCLVSSTCISSHNAWGKPQGTLRTRTESRVTASIVPRRQFVPRCTNFLGSILRFCLLATMLVACAGTARSDSTCN